MANTSYQDLLGGNTTTIELSNGATVKIRKLSFTEMKTLQEQKIAEDSREAMNITYDAQMFTVKNGLVEPALTEEQLRTLPFETFIEIAAKIYIFNGIIKDPFKEVEQEPFRND